MRRPSAATLRRLKAPKGKAMQFSKERNLIRVVRISGPMHNFLALELAESPTDTRMDELEAPGSRNLDPEAVRREVATGVAEAASSLGLKVFVKRLRFVPTDTGPAEIYRGLADALVRHFAAEIPSLHSQTKSQPVMLKQGRDTAGHRHGAHIRQNEG